MAALDEVEWRSPEWININGLRTDNVLEYFSQSPFWDRQCNNQILKMQRQFNGTLMIIPTFDSELRKLRGIEYVLYMVKEPDLWIIRRQMRNGDGSKAFNKNPIENMTINEFLNGGPGFGVVDDVEILQDYFIVGSSVYQAPIVADITRQGILSVSCALNECVSLLDDLY